MGKALEEVINLVARLSVLLFALPNLKGFSFKD